MPSSSKPAVTERQVGRVRDSSEQSTPAGLVIAGWLVPGAAHALAGQYGKAAILFITLSAMFVIGVASGGRLFPFVPSDPLLFLAACAEWLLGLPRVVAALAGYGVGDVVAATYEYGNTFLIVAGLLNALALLDAVDVASGRKTR